MNNVAKLFKDPNYLPKQTSGSYLLNNRLELAMAILAKLHERGRHTPLAILARYFECSQSWLEMTITCMRDTGLIRSIRGPGGGYELAKPLGQITVAHVIDAVCQADDRSPAMQSVTAALLKTASHIRLSTLV